MLALSRDACLSWRSTKETEAQCEGAEVFSVQEDGKCGIMLYKQGPMAVTGCEYPEKGTGSAR